MSTILAFEQLTTLVAGPYQRELAGAQIAVLQGPSGCGKSLLLRALADLDQHGGKIFCQGQEHQALSAPQWRRLVAYMPAESAWWNDCIGSHILPHPQRREWLQSLQLPEESLTWSVARCSSGERQRLALLAALCRNPRVLLLDEPTASCDPTTTASLEELLQRWVQEEERGILMISHDPEQAARIADCIWRMDAKGSLIDPDNYDSL